MLHSRFMTWLLPVALLPFSALAATGQEFPTKPIRIVAGAPGGSSDFAARTVAQGMAGLLGQNVVVENRSFGVQAIENVIRAQPDGHTLLYYGSALLVGPLLTKLSYDPVKDLSPVCMVLISPNVLLVHPSVPAKSVKELIALARKEPGKLNYGSGEAGSSLHIAAELFKHLTNTNIVRVPFKGQGPALIATLAGEVQMSFASAGGLSGHISQGRVRPLAVTGASRSPAYPDLPTIAEAGVPGYESAQRSGLWVPNKVPAAIMGKLNKTIVQVTRQNTLRERFAKDGIEPVGSSIAEFDKAIRSEIARLSKLVEAANLRIPQ
jgi:tripartite-type tricarboxylate transporter receptor subunit TctC